MRDLSTCSCGEIGVVKVKNTFEMKQINIWKRRSILRKCVHFIFRLKIISGLSAVKNISIIIISSNRREPIGSNQ